MRVVGFTHDDGPGWEFPPPEAAGYFRPSFRR
jgi:hypothetical protein